MDYLTKAFIHEITVGIVGTNKACAITVGVSRGGHMTELDNRIYRAAVATGVPIMTHLAIGTQPAIVIFQEEGLDLGRELFGHVDVGVNHAQTPTERILEVGDRLGFDTFGYETELPDPPFWARPRKDRMDHFLRTLGAGNLEKLDMATVNTRSAHDIDSVETWNSDSCGADRQRRAPLTAGAAVHPATGRLTPT